MSKLSKRRYYGIIIPGPLADRYSFSSIPQTADELNRLTRAQQLEVTRTDAEILVHKINKYAEQGKPVPLTTEHMENTHSHKQPRFTGTPTRTGSVHRAWISPKDNGSVYAEFSFDETEGGAEEAHFLLEQNVFRGLSLRHNMTHLEPQELSLCGKGARAGSVVVGEMSEQQTHTGGEMSISSQTNTLQYKPGSETTSSNPNPIVAASEIMSAPSVLPQTSPALQQYVMQQAAAQQQQQQQPSSSFPAAGAQSPYTQHLLQQTATNTAPNPLTGYNGMQQQQQPLGGGGGDQAQAQAQAQAQQQQQQTEEQAQQAQQPGKTPELKDVLQKLATGKFLNADERRHLILSFGEKAEAASKAHQFMDQRMRHLAHVMNSLLQKVLGEKLPQDMESSMLGALQNNDSNQLVSQLLPVVVAASEQYSMEKAMLMDYQKVPGPAQVQQTPGASIAASSLSLTPMTSASASSASSSGREFVLEDPELAKAFKMIIDNVPQRPRPIGMAAPYVPQQQQTMQPLQSTIPTGSFPIPANHVRNMNFPVPANGFRGADVRASATPTMYAPTAVAASVQQQQQPQVSDNPRSWLRHLDPTLASELASKAGTNYGDAFIGGEWYSNHAISTPPSVFFNENGKRVRND